MCHLEEYLDFSLFSVKRNLCQSFKNPENSILMSLPPVGPRTKVVIGSRESELAMIQSRHIRSLLSAAHPTLTFVIETSSSLGDQVQNVPLSVVGASNPGLFTKSLETHIVTGKYDLAVHSLKDMPTTLPDGLTLSAITEREDPTDALVLHPFYNNDDIVNIKTKTLADLPKGAIVGTSSLRRQALINRYHPHLTVISIRGNLNTRLAKLDQSTPLSGRNNASATAAHNTTTATTATTSTTTSSTSTSTQLTVKRQKTAETNTKNTSDDWVGALGVHYDAIVLATAGLKRMGWSERISQVLDHFQYGISQGALGIETRENDVWMNDLVHTTLSDWKSTMRCLCERSFLRALQGGCQVPIGATTTLSHNNNAKADAKTDGDHSDQVYLELHGIVLALDGASFAEGTHKLLLPNVKWQNVLNSNNDDYSHANAVEELGRRVAEETKSKGADALLGRGDTRAITYSEVATD